jgi:hypothetical protein
MKVETTVFLSEDLLSALGTQAADAEDRSELEAALREYLPRLRDPRDGWLHGWTGRWPAPSPTRRQAQGDRPGEGTAADGTGPLGR